MVGKITNGSIFHKQFPVYCLVKLKQFSFCNFESFFRCLFTQTLLVCIFYFNQKLFTNCEKTSTKPQHKLTWGWHENDSHHPPPPPTDPIWPISFPGSSWKMSKWHLSWLFYLLQSLKLLTWFGPKSKVWYLVSSKRSQKVALVQQHFYIFGQRGSSCPYKSLLLPNVHLS